MFYKLLFICSVFIAFGVYGQSSPPNGGQSSPPNGGQSSPLNPGQSSSPNGGQSSPLNPGQSSSPNGDQSSPPNGDQSGSPNGDQSVTPSVNGDQSSTPSIDVNLLSALSWNSGMQLALIQTSFYRNLDSTNQNELLAIVQNKQTSLNDMNTELEEWYQKQPPQIQTAFTLYLQNLGQAEQAIKAHSRQMQTNLSPAAQAYLQQLYGKDYTKTPEQIDEENAQRYQALPPNVQQELRQYDAEELQFDQQTFYKYLSNRSKRYIHF